MTLMLADLKITNYDGTMRFHPKWTDEMKQDFYSLTYWNLHHWQLGTPEEYRTIKQKFLDKYDKLYSSKGLGIIQEMEFAMNRNPDYQNFWSNRGVEYSSMKYG